MEAVNRGSAMDEVASILAGELGEELSSEKEEVEVDSSTTEVSEEETEEAEEIKAESEGEEKAEDGEDVTWSAALGVDDNLVALDDNGDLKGFKIKVDGEESVVPVAEVVAGYRNNKYNTQKSQALAEEYKQFTEAKTTISQGYAQKVESLEKVVEYVKGQFLRDYQGIDWTSLRNSNPAEYAAMVQDLQMRTAEFDNMQAVLEQERINEIEATKKESQAAQQQRIKEQLDIVLQNNPEWKSPETLKKAVEDMGSFVGEVYGFTPQEFMSIQDPRMIEVVKDAMKFRKGFTEAKQKLVQQTPKFQKQAAKKTNVTKLDRLIKNAKTATGTNKRKAEVDAVTQLLLDTGGA